MNCRISPRLKEAKVIDCKVSIYKQEGTEVRNCSCLRKHSLFLLFLTSLSYLNSAVYFSIRVCVGTWNVGGKLPRNDFDIDDWLDINHPADIYVLG
jgi:hypothetical protein